MSAPASAVPASATVARTLLRLADLERPAVQFSSIEGGDRSFGVRRARHLDESKPAWPAGVPIHDDLDFGDLSALLLEDLTKRTFIGVVREISNVESGSAWHHCLLVPG